MEHNAVSLNNAAPESYNIESGGLSGLLGKTFEHP